MSDPESRPSPEPVWTYRGYQLKAGEFTTAMVHFFRAEVQRANVWRQRLDTTFNWAVVTTAAAISFAFTDTPGSHVAILLDLLLVTLFLYIEARRYRYYELWASRVRLMETDFFASMLVPPFHPAPDWAETLAESLLHPSFPISATEAVGRRLRRNYLMVYLVIGAAWLVKVALLPASPAGWNEFFARAAIGDISGQIVAGFGALFYLGIFIFSLATRNLNHAAGEVLPRFSAGQSPRAGRAWFRPSRRRAEMLTFIITSQPQAVTSNIMNEMKRGVTILPATGGFTGEPKPVLMCALTVTEVAHLKELVAQADPAAFVIVTPAQEVLGGGFSPLKTEEP